VGREKRSLSKSINGVEGGLDSLLGGGGGTGKPEVFVGNETIPLKDEKN